MSTKKALEALKRLACEDDGMLARFEEGKPADPTEHMSPEDAKRWHQMNDEHGDNFKGASELAQLAKLAMEFPTEEARKKYLQSHPKADPAKHTVKKKDGPAKKDDGGKKDQGGSGSSGGESAGAKRIHDVYKGVSPHIRETLNSITDKSFDSDRGYSAKPIKDAIKALKSKVTPDEAKSLLSESEKAYSKAIDALSAASKGEGGFSSPEYKGALKVYNQAQNTMRVFRQLAEDAKEKPWKKKGSVDQALEILARFSEGESVDVAEYLREHGNAEAAEAWEEMNDKYGDKFKEAAYEPGKIVPDAKGKGEGSDTPDGEGNKEKRAFHRQRSTWAASAGETVNLFALVGSDGFLYGATDDRHDARSRTFWTRQADESSLIEAHVVDLEGVPLHVAESLKDVGTPASKMDGLDAWKVAKKYVAGQPRRLAADELETTWFRFAGQVVFTPVRKNQKLRYLHAYIPSDNTDESEEKVGIYETVSGEWQVQAEVRERTNYDTQQIDLVTDLNKAKDIAKGWLQKNSKTAASVQGLYGFPKGIQAACEVASRRISKAALKVAKEIYAKDERVAQFLQAHAKKASSLPAKVLLAAMKEIGPKIAEEDIEPSDNDAPEKEAALNDLRAKRAAMYGLYGFPEKVATLGLNACTTVRAEAGRVASDLHRRKADHHERISGFLKEHCKTAKCLYSKMLLSSYPDASVKLASGSNDWIAWEQD